MIYETLQVMHKVHQTIITSDIDNFDSDRKTSAIPNKPITTPQISQPQTEWNYNLPIPQNTKLKPKSSDQVNLTGYNKINLASKYTMHPHFHHLNKLKRLQWI